MLTVLCVIWNTKRAKKVESVTKELGFEYREASTTSDATAILHSTKVDVVVTALGRGADDSCGPILNELRRSCIFSIVYSTTADQHPKSRLWCFDSGARMVTNNIAALAYSLKILALQGTGGGMLTCPTCYLPGLTEDELHMHHPLYHSSEPNHSCCCPICRKTTDNIDVHIHNKHGPTAGREATKPHFNVFTWVVCQRESDGKFVMVNEPAGIKGSRPLYWLPAGRVDAGETIIQAGERETVEEAGVVIQIEGVLHFMLHGSTLRVVLFAHPVHDDATCKTVPDFESVGSLWVAHTDLGDLDHTDYRSPDPPQYFPAVADRQLLPQPVNTPAFRNLEQLVSEFTRRSLDKQEDRQDLSVRLEEVWKQLREEYPSSAFLGPRKVTESS